MLSKQYFNMSERLWFGALLKSCWCWSSHFVLWEACEQNSSEPFFLRVLFFFLFVAVTTGKVSPQHPPSRDMWATLCFSSLQRLPSLLWIPVAGVNNKAVTWGAAAAALQHLLERLCSSYSRWTLLHLKERRSVTPNPWGCSSSLCSGARVCMYWSLSCNSRNCESEGFWFWHYLTARSDRKHCSNDSANSPHLTLFICYLYTPCCLFASQLSAY